MIYTLSCLAPFPFPLLQVCEAKREANKSSSFSAAGDWGSPPLRSSLRWQDGGGTLDLLGRRVNRSCRCWGGVALVVVAAACPIMVPELQPHLDVACCDVEKLVGVLFLGAVGGAVAAAAFGILVLPLLPRLDGGRSVAVEGLWRLVYRSPLRRISSSCSASPAGRGGVERSWCVGVICFC